MGVPVWDDRMGVPVWDDPKEVPVWDAPKEIPLGNAAKEIPLGRGLAIPRLASRNIEQLEFRLCEQLMQCGVECMRDVEILAVLT
jgi:hypothetical protein